MVREEIKKISYIEAVDSWGVVQKLMRFSLPIKAQYLLKKNMESIISSVKPLEEKRLALIQTYGKKKDNGKMVIDENNEDFLNLMRQEIEVLIAPIELELLGNVHLTQAEMRVISFMLQEEKSKVVIPETKVLI